MRMQLSNQSLKTVVPLCFNSVRDGNRYRVCTPVYIRHVRVKRSIDNSTHAFGQIRNQMFDIYKGHQDAALGRSTTRNGSR